MIDYCVLGSGVAGSTIANLLSKKYSVLVLDKARGPGGRSSNKRFKSKLGFDHGVQYFSPKTKEFKKFILNLNNKKIIKTWDGNHLDFTFEKKKNNLKYIGRRANNDICKYLLKKINQKYFFHICKINYKKNFWEICTEDGKKIYSKFLIITCPFPQMKKLANKYLNKKIVKLKVKMDPNLTVMLALKNQKNLPISSIKFDDDILKWASNENSKSRFKSNTGLWTIQCSLKYSKKNINIYKNNKNILNFLISRFLKLTGFDKNNILFKKIHGWKYAYNSSPTKIKSYLNKKYSLGICGDWLIGSKAEDAWISANDLYNSLETKKPSIKKY